MDEVNNEFDVILNVGHGKFDAQNHIYDLTPYDVSKEYEERAVDKVKTLSPRSVDNAIKDGSSTTNIPQDLQKSSGNGKISEKNSKPTQERYSLDVSELDKWFESLSLKELKELVGNVNVTESIQELPSKKERREAYVRRLYDNGTLNELVTKIVKSKPQMARCFANTKMNNKYNPFYVLASAFVGGQDVIPVEHEVKEFKEKENAPLCCNSIREHKKRWDRSPRDHR